MKIPVGTIFVYNKKVWKIIGSAEFFPSHYSTHECNEDGTVKEDYTYRHVTFPMDIVDNLHPSCFVGSTVNDKDILSASARELIVKLEKEIEYNKNRIAQLKEIFNL